MSVCLSVCLSVCVCVSTFFNDNQTRSENAGYAEQNESPTNQTRPNVTLTGASRVEWRTNKRNERRSCTFGAADEIRLRGDGDEVHGPVVERIPHVAAAATLGVWHAEAMAICSEVIQFGEVL